MDVAAGNSSSGIIEVPSFGIPTINVGEREGGRISGDTVINVEGDYVSLKEAFEKAFSKDFRKCCKRSGSAQSLYGKGDAAKRIIKIIKEKEFTCSKKRFFDLTSSICKPG